MRLHLYNATKLAYIVQNVYHGTTHDNMGNDLGSLLSNPEMQISSENKSLTSIVDMSNINISLTRNN